MKIKSVITSTLILAGVAVPLGFAFARHIQSDVDLTKNIVVISEERNELGQRTYPMDPVWNKVIEKWKHDHPSEASKFNIVVKHGDQSAFEELATLGVTAQSMPDVWFFPSNRLPFLLDYGAINPMSEDDKARIFNKTHIDPTNASYEGYNGHHYASRFKMETVFFFMNKHKLKTIFSNDALALGNSIIKTNSTNQFDVKINLVGGEQVNLASGSLTIDDLFKYIIQDSTTANADVPFDLAHKRIAEWFSNNLDFTKVAQTMSKGGEYKKILPLNGANKWWANTFVYATGEPKKGGLIWDQEGKPTSQIMKWDNPGASRDVMKTFFDLSTKGPKEYMANNGVKTNFEKGNTAFTISGTWDNDRFVSAFKDAYKDEPNIDKFIEDNLFAIGLPVVSDTNGKSHRLRHYIQGKSFGINSRNRPGGEKYNATLDLISEMYTEDIQRLYSNEVEQYVPGNIEDGIKLFQGKSYIDSVLQLIQKESERTVELSEVSPLYETADFGQIWEDVTHPLAADLSGNVSMNNFDNWVSGSIDLLKQKGFVEPKDE